MDSQADAEQQQRDSSFHYNPAFSLGYRDWMTDSEKENQSVVDLATSGPPP